MPSSKPSPDLKTLAGRIRYVREGHGLTQQQLAKILGIERGSPGNWELGGGMKAENKVLFSKRFAIDHQWLVLGSGDPPKMPSRPELKLANSKRSMDDILDQGERNPTEKVGRVIFAGGNKDDVLYTEIPQVAARIKIYIDDAGASQMPIGKNAVEAMPIMATWKIPAEALRKQLSGGPIGRIHIVECTDDVMEPTILEGDLAFVDTAHKEQDSGIVAYLDSAGVHRLRRVERVDDMKERLRFIPDNPKYSKFERPSGEINIIGRYICRLTRD